MEKMLVLKMRKDNAKQAAPTGAARFSKLFCDFCGFCVRKIKVLVRQPPKPYQRRSS